MGSVTRLPHTHRKSPLLVGRTGTGYGPWHFGAVLHDQPRLHVRFGLCCCVKLLLEIWLHFLVGSERLIEPVTQVKRTVDVVS